MTTGRLAPIGLPLLLALTLGLAPFRPEPHVLEKLRWLITGQALRPVDWFDLALHGLPWVWLAATLIRIGIRRDQR